MSELRWIILGIGVIVVAAIYFWESWKQKRELRSKVDSFPGTTADSYDNIHISPKKEKHRENNIDLSAAATAFNSYLKKSRGKDQSSSAAANDSPGTFAPAEPELSGKKEETGKDINVDKETIIVIYIVTSSGSRLRGKDILAAFKAVDLKYGEMQIFHYLGEGDEFKDRPLFSVANIHEPGTFDSNNMEDMTTEGLAMFMRLPAPIGGDIAFEIMIDCARALANQLGGELRNREHAVLDSDSINHLRMTASKY